MTNKKRETADLSLDRKIEFFYYYKVPSDEFKFDYLKWAKKFFLQKKIKTIKILNRYLSHIIPKRTKKGKRQASPITIEIVSSASPSTS